MTVTGIATREAATSRPSRHWGECLFLILDRDHHADAVDTSSRIRRRSNGFGGRHRLRPSGWDG